MKKSEIHHSIRHKGVYLLPNAFTTGNLFAGFFAIVQAMNGRFFEAAFAIFLAMILDSMDGRVARLTHTQSVFGEQYDSMSDMVSFGVAPGLVMYEFVLHDLGRWGWIAAFIYVAGAALRLARFNANIAVVDSRYFQGLPSPAAAGILAGFVMLSVDYQLSSNPFIQWACLILTIFAGVTMVTNIPYFSGKKMGIRHRMPIVTVMLALLIVFALVMVNPPLFLFLIFFFYALSGYIVLFVKYRKGHKISDDYSEVSVRLASMREEEDEDMSEVVDPIEKIKEVVKSVNLEGSVQNSSTPFTQDQVSNSEQSES